MFDLQFQQIIHTVSFRCLTFISPDLKRFQHETSTTLTATTNSSSHENTLVQRAHARFPLARGGYNNSRQCQSHFRSPTETPVSGLLLETNNKTIKLKCSAFDNLFPQRYCRILQRSFKSPPSPCKDPSQYCQKDHLFKVFSVNKVLARTRE